MPPRKFFEMNMRWDVSLCSRRLDRLSKKVLRRISYNWPLRGQKRLAPFAKRSTCRKSSAWIVVDIRKNGRARKRHACLPHARPFSLFPTTSKRLLRRLLRCSLVHFQTQFREMLQIVHWPRRVWMIFPIYLIIYCSDNNIFFGGGGGSRAFWGGSFYPSNTLDRTLDYINVVSCHKGSLRTPDVFPVVASLPPIFLGRWN